MPDRVALRQLILSAFAPSQLSQAVKTAPGGAELWNEIEWKAGAKAVADAVIEGVEQRGTMAFLEALLRKERPDRVDDINAIFSDIPRAGPGEITLPVVTFAMTQVEAAELPDDQRKLLEKELGEDALLRYGETRDDWTPARDPPGTDAGKKVATARELVERVIARHNDGGPQRIVPEFKSEEYFGANGSEIWDAYNTKCFLLMLDPISLLHHALKFQLLQSGAHTAHKVIMVAFPAIPPSSINKIVDEALKKNLVAAHKQFRDLNPLRELGIGSALGLERWLFSVFPRVVDLALLREPHPATRNLMNSMGPGPAIGPRGVR